LREVDGRKTAGRSVMCLNPVYGGLKLTVRNLAAYNNQLHVHDLAEYSQPTSSDRIGKGRVEIFFGSP
jgi:archaellum biogenesis ATPase FlaH